MKKARAQKLRALVFFISPILCLIVCSSDCVFDVYFYFYHLFQSFDPLLHLFLRFSYLVPIRKRSRRHQLPLPEHVSGTLPWFIGVCMHAQHSHAHNLFRTVGRLSRELSVVVQRVRCGLPLQRPALFSSF